MESWLRDLVTATRRSRRELRATLAIVVTLALGIGATTATFSVLHAVVLAPLPYRQAHELVQLGEVDLRAPAAAPYVSAATFLDWHEQTRAFRYLEAYCSRAFDVLGEEYPERVSGAVVTPEFFAMLGIEAAHGRLFSASPEFHDSVVLSDRAWQRFHGRDPALIGRTLELSGSPYRVVGVLPASFQPIPAGAELWIPTSEPAPAPGGFLSSLTSLREAGASRDMRYLGVIGRLRQEVDLGRARADVETVTSALKQTFPDSYASHAVAVKALRDPLIGAVSRPLWVVFGAVVWVLLIACSNVAALQAARGVDRRRELSIRSALGANRSQLFRQLLIESVMIALLAGALGLLATHWLIEGLLAGMPASLPRLAEVRIDAVVLGFTLATSLAIGVILGLLPAKVGWRTDLMQMLIGRGATPQRLRVGARGLLIACQVGSAFVLLVGAGLVIRSHLALNELELGFESAGLIVLRMTTDDLAAASDPVYEQLAEDIAALPTVRSVTRASTVPLAGGEAAVPFVAETDRATPIVVGWRVVGPGYFRTLGVPVEAGHEFDGRETAATTFGAVVSRSAADRFWPGEEPIGKRISLDMGAGEPWWSEVIGVVGELRYTGLRRPPGPEVYYSLDQNPQLAAYYLVRTSDSFEPLMGELRRLAAEILPGRPVASLQTMSEMLRTHTAELRSYALLLGVSGLAAVFLAAIGLYGMLIHGIAQSWHELGVRAALGASRRKLAGLVLQRALGWVAIGLACGLIAAVGLGKVLASLLFEVEVYDAVTLAVCAGLFGVVTFLATYPAARRAVRVDPALALRSD